MLGWITLEIFFSIKLEEYFIKKGVFRDLIEKLNREWTVHKKMRYLKNEGIIPTEEFKRYDNLRMIRNRIIHSEYRPTSDEAEECKQVANDILWALFRMDSIEYNSYLNRIKMLS